MKFDYATVIARAHYHNRETLIIQRKLKEAFRSEKNRFLDVGFGRGKYLDMARSIGYQPYGIEVNQEYIDQARAKGYTCFHLNDIQQIENKFSIILISHVIEHLKPGDLVAVLESYIEMLEPDGMLILASPLRGDRFYYDVTHERPYYPQSIWHAFGGNREELSLGRNRSALRLKDIYFIRDCYRTRNLRAYYINDGLGVEYTLLRMVNYTLAWLYIISASRIGVRASWLGFYQKDNAGNTI